MTNTAKITVSVPGAVYSDFLNPLCSSVADEWNLPEPERRKRGRGHSYIYEGLSIEQADAIERNLRVRAENLLGGSSDEYGRRTYYSALKTAKRIDAQIVAALA